MCVDKGQQRNQQKRAYTGRAIAGLISKGHGKQLNAKITKTVCLAHFWDDHSFRTGLPQAPH